MSDEHEAPTNEENPTALTLSVKLGRTMNRGNYENDRYDVFVPVPWVPGEPVGPLMAQAFAEARAEIARQSEYDKRIRDLREKYYYPRGQTVEEWDNLIAKFSADPDLQQWDRDWLVRQCAEHRASRIEAEAKERAAKARMVEIAADVIKRTVEYTNAHPMPEPAELWADVPRHGTPAYYSTLHEWWVTGVPGFGELSPTVRTALQRTTVGAIIEADARDILEGDLRRRERPDGLMPPARPTHDEEWAHLEEDEEDNAPEYLHDDHL